MDHYAEAFYVEPGRCWRMVTTDRQGMPNHCDEPAVWRGRFRSRKGKWHMVDSCDGHVDDQLVGVKRVTAP